MVTCFLCHQEFPPAFDGGDRVYQGYRCSSTTGERGIVGHYGSTLIDMEFWAWKDAMPEEVYNAWIEDINAAMCDACIDDLIKSGKLVKDKVGIW